MTTPHVLAAAIATALDDLAIDLPPMTVARLAGRVAELLDLREHAAFVAAVDDAHADLADELSREAP